jgi:hypothetical protein
LIVENILNEIKEKQQVKSETRLFEKYIMIVSMQKMWKFDLEALP